MSWESREQAVPYPLLSEQKRKAFKGVPSIACGLDPWVSRCGVCLRLQGMTSALNHVAPCRECAQCNQPAIFLTHKLSEGLTPRLDTHRMRLQPFHVSIRANSDRVFWPRRETFHTFVFLEHRSQRNIPLNLFINPYKADSNPNTPPYEATVKRNRHF